MSVELITDQAALADLCRSLATSDGLAIDTEFMRERTYRAKLCLIQIANSQITACVDPLAVPDLGPLLALLHTPSIRKVMHAARQDLEVFYDLDGQVAAPVFDTQIAAAFLGHDEQIGYGSLVSAVAGVALAKTETRTDWSARPLTAAQIQYASDDVLYLRPVYETLRTELDRRGRLSWTEAQCAMLADENLYRTDPADAWRRLRGGADLPPDQQQILRHLAEWREREAQSRDLPRSWIVRDDALYELARRAPETAQSLANIPGLDERALRRHHDGILDAVRAGRQAGPEAIWVRQGPLNPDQAARARKLMEQVRVIANQLELAPSILATRRDIDRIVRGASPSELFSGWRAEVMAPVLAGRN